MDLDFLAITISPQLDYEKCMVKLGKDSSILPPYFYKEIDPTHLKASEQ